MCLLDELLAWDARSLVCTARSHLAPDNPLRRDGRLAAIHAVEYAGQASALHSALVAKDGAPVWALLGALNDLTLERAYLDDLPAPLVISVSQELVMGHCASYRFSLDCAGLAVARGRLTVAAQGAGARP
jgi:predicted hotdog family 3-hydroxylacyl-ACP dehydratase